MGLRLLCLLFQENPLQVLTGNTVPTLLAPDTRNQIFEEIGVEQVFMPSFREVMNLETEAFVHTVLKQYCKAEKVYCGFNFHFGKGERPARKNSNSWRKVRNRSNCSTSCVFAGRCSNQFNPRYAITYRTVRQRWLPKCWDVIFVINFR